MYYRELWLFVKKTFSSDIRRISEKYKDEFAIETIETNLSRQKIISVILLIINAILIYVDTRRLAKLWPDMVGYRNLFYAHIFIVVFLSIHIVLMYLRNNGFLNRNIKFDRLLHRMYAFIILNWCAILSVNAQLIHKQISAYIIGIFCVSSLAILSPIESLIIYSFSYGVFVIGMIILPKDGESFSGNIINSLFLIALAYVISRIVYSSRVEEFKNRKIIVEKNNELDNSHRSLEELINKKTNELQKANELLIEEIYKRHEAEIEAIKSKIMYDEKTKRLNQAMEYDNLRASFFATLSHELKTPLNVIFSAQQIMDNLLDKEMIENNVDKLHKYVRIIRQNCYRLIRIVGNLIDITKIDADHFEVNLENCDIVRVVEDITLSVAEYIESKNIALIFDTNVEEKTIACDPEKVERIILNLLSNAVKFTPEGGSIYVSINEEKEKIVISVKDTGIGIPKEMQSKIFERFIQVNETKKQNKDGSGIGLSLVKSLVELHNGQVAVSSDMGKGSEFIVEFPDTKLESYEKHGNNSVTNNDDKVEKISIEFSDIYFD